MKIREYLNKRKNVGSRRKYSPEEQLKIAKMNQILVESMRDVNEDMSNMEECAYRAWLGYRAVMGYSNEGLGLTPSIF